MRLIAVLIFLQISAPVLASGWTDFHGRNAFGEYITLSEEWMSDPDNSDQSRESGFFVIAVQQNGKVIDEFKNQSCGFTTSSNEFSCASQGKSPLSGSTYRFKKTHVPRDSLTMECGQIADCVQGCGDHAPVELFRDPWECYDEAVCTNLKISKDGVLTRVAIEGVVNRDKVNLRENPHTASRILSTLAQGTKVKVLEGAGSCLVINGKPGEWVMVKVFDKEATKEGWLYDADVGYQPDSK